MKKPIVIAMIAVLIIAGSAFAVKKYNEQYSFQPGKLSSYLASKGIGSGDAGSGCGSGACGGAGAQAQATGGTQATGSPTGRGGCGGGGGGGGCGSGAPLDTDAAREAISNYYAQKYGETDFTVDFKDFGCHQEAYIIQDGAPVKTFSISGGRITET